MLRSNWLCINNYIYEFLYSLFYQILPIISFRNRLTGPCAAPSWTRWRSHGSSFHRSFGTCSPFCVQCNRRRGSELWCCLEVIVLHGSLWIASRFACQPKGWRILLLYEHLYLSGVVSLGSRWRMDPFCVQCLSLACGTDSDGPGSQQSASQEGHSSP